MKEEMTKGERSICIWKKEVESPRAVLIRRGKTRAGRGWNADLDRGESGRGHGAGCHESLAPRIYHGVKTLQRPCP
jgi:hypothetical protein